MLKKKKSVNVYIFISHSVLNLPFKNIVLDFFTLQIEKNDTFL